MRDYESTSKALRCCRLTSERGCAECPFSLNSNEKCANLLPDAADAIEELLAENDHLREAAKMMPKWISVEERLPEIRRSVLLFNGAVHIGWRVDGQRYRFLSDRFPDHPTHWMPLPEPPKEVE